MTFFKQDQDNRGDFFSMDSGSGTSSTAAAVENQRMQPRARAARKECSKDRFKDIAESLIEVSAILRRLVNQVSECQSYHSEQGDDSDSNDLRSDFREQRRARLIRRKEADGSEYYFVARN